MAEAINSWEIRIGDCVELMANMPENSVDAIVTDPPYGLEFMGQEWDKLGTSSVRWEGGGGFSKPGLGDRPERVAVHLPKMQAWHFEWAKEALRVLKPGAHLIAFGGTRTHHRLMCALENAGFEMRDCLMWLYGSGFPKSLDVSKAIDRAAGVEKEDKFEGAFKRHAGPTGNKKCEKCGHWLISGDPCCCPRPQDAPVTDDAKQWPGWGTALKPAWEPIILARKPLSEPTVAANVVKWGTGALNINGCRVSTEGEVIHTPQSDPEKCRGTVGADLGITRADKAQFQEAQAASVEKANRLGRWPANVVLDEEAARMVDEQAGPQSSGGTPKRRFADKTRNAYGLFHGEENPLGIGASSGRVSRFFYCAKADRTEREQGRPPLGEENPLLWSSGTENPGSFQAEGTKRQVWNNHPTVKPTALMAWLCRLVTPPGGLILDPFMGSGSTGIAALWDGFRFVGLEKDAKWAGIAKQRIIGDAPLLNQLC